MYLSCSEQALYKNKTRQVFNVPLQERDSGILQDDLSRRWIKIKERNQGQQTQRTSAVSVGSHTRLRGLETWKVEKLNQSYRVLADKSLITNHNDNPANDYAVQNIVNLQNHRRGMFRIQDELEKHVEKTRNGEYFPVDTICPYLGLRKEPYIKFKTAPKNQFCLPRQPTKEECKRAAIHYKVDSPAIKCKDHPQKDLCTITNQWRSSIETRINARCEISRCGMNPIFVASMDPRTGRLQEIHKWYNFTSKADIENKIHSIVVRDSKNGFNFCFVQCQKNGSSEVIKTLLVFPPVVRTVDAKRKWASFNVNVVVLNSVSRAHFYRSLPESVATLRDIVYRRSIPATAFDFELLQSLGPGIQNFQNFNPGNNVKVKTVVNQGNKIAALLSELKKLGYWTLLQTDACWFNKSTGAKPPPETSEEEFIKLCTLSQERAMKQNIDDPGMTRFPCEGLMSNITVQLDGGKPNLSCFNGRYLHNYFLEYVMNIGNALRSSKIGSPFFSYSYLTVARENSGVRIKQIDESLSNFLYFMAMQKDTLTIVTSDHGSATTKYSLASVEGKYEIYDSLLFMIVPNDVASRLGAKRMQHLTTNQHRLITINDVYKTLVSIGTQKEQHLTSFDNVGLLSEIPENRTCADVGIRQGALCKCQGWEKWLQNNHPQFFWIAEFVLGQLNNEISQVFSEEAINIADKSSYGECLRLAGYAIENIHHRAKEETSVLSMDIVVQPNRQVFEVQVQLPMRLLSSLSAGNTAFQTPQEVIKLLHFRISGFDQDFPTCSDYTASVYHCVCHRYNFSNSSNIGNYNYRWKRMKLYDDVLSIIAGLASGFNVKPEIQILDRRSKCLFLLKRTHFSHTKAYELLNVCDNWAFIVQVDLIEQRAGPIQFITANFPMMIKMTPRTFHFLFSAYQPQGHFHLKLKIYYKVIRL